MRNNNKHIQEYARVMRSVDISDEAERRIIQNCAAQMGAPKLDIAKPAIAAISCAAVAVAVVGVPKLRKRSKNG